ncbi:conserved hypothetical protein [Verticillium alfalfae VaMs.102]|uniref:DUF7719 domain-containing protein n=1 Tax=Verticillium alfalfae (strain VaMs.102 / ATCC MYA-4576 / FGSC 10136) TaxID=526221 RepID=C9SS91_VERA1|nr:conserved hypothetical protein [Verticillium alfalfae VaMs.102]EEY21656.1 conserved hypothetical protein [Verticillium alfalfae VaMs.102]
MGKMARQRREKAAGTIKLAHPDRSDPTEDTLLQMAHERGLFQQADADPRNKTTSRSTPAANSEDEDDAADADADGTGELSPTAERIMDSLLWTVSLAMLHFTLDVVVQHQYGIDIDWHAIILRALQAFAALLVLFYVLHAHPSKPTFVPRLPLRYQDPLRQLLFFTMGVTSGCYLIYITNTFGYLAVMKKAPTLGCLWVWAVIELPLGPAAASLVICAAFLWQGGYDIK